MDKIEKIKVVENLLKKQLKGGKINNHFLNCFKQLEDDYCLPYGGKNPLYLFKYSLDEQGYLNDYYYEFDCGIVIELNINDGQVEILHECPFDSHFIVEDNFCLDSRILENYSLNYYDLELDYNPLEFRLLRIKGVKVLLVFVDKSLQEAKAERGLFITNVFKEHWKSFPRKSKRRFLGVTWSHGLATGYDGNHNVTIKEMLIKASAVQGKEICVSIKGQEIGPMGLYFRGVIPEIAFSDDVWSEKTKHGERYVNFCNYPNKCNLIVQIPRGLRHPWKRSCEAWIVPHKNKKFTFWIKRWFLEKIKEEGGEELENLNKLLNCFEVEIIE